jgi:hypothetical protein
MTSIFQIVDVVWGILHAGNTNSRLLFEEGREK